MKKKLAFSLLTTVAVCGGLLLLRTGTPGNPHTPVAKASPPTSTTTDSAAVFQKAFWKRPVANDKILHAERREWKDAGGVTKWQWFVAVQPSASLRKHLLEDNAFRLVRAGSAKLQSEAPDWFAFTEAETESWQSTAGGMQLWFSSGENLLYAAGDGGGFQAGAPERASVARESLAQTGRLSFTPPPSQQ